MHIFGNGKGEATVVRLPDGKWGVVDCYARDLADPDRNPVVAFLQSRTPRPTELEFVCLTHPHDDHYRGMSHLFQRFQVRRFWRFTGCLPPARERTVRAWAAQIRAAGKRHQIDEARTSVRDLCHTLALADHGRKVDRPAIDRPNITQDVYTWPTNDETAVLRIQVVAPSRQHRESYTRQTTLDASVRHNDISLALVIEYGVRRVFLGGDVEEDNWARILQENEVEPPVRFRRTAVVKVCHHGSPNGYHRPLWQLLSPDRRAVAVVTPYLYFGHPTRDAVADIRRHSKAVYVTNRHAVDWLPATLGAQVHPEVDDDADRSRKQRRHRAAVAAGDFLEIAPVPAAGRCTLRVPPTPATVEVELHGPAADISN